MLTECNSYLTTELRRIPLHENQEVKNGLHNFYEPQYERSRTRHNFGELTLNIGDNCLLNLKKEEREKALLIVGGILALILLLSGGEK